MTKKAVKTVDRQIAKVESKYEKEGARLVEDGFLVESLAVLAHVAEELYRAGGNAVPENISLALSEIKRRGQRLEALRTHRDTLTSALKSGRFANIDAVW